MMFISDTCHIDELLRRGEAESFFIPQPNGYRMYSMATGVIYIRQNKDTGAVEFMSSETIWCWMPWPDFMEWADLRVKWWRLII